MDIAEIIKRVERLTGADQLVDDDIRWAIGEWKNLGGLWREHKVTGERERYHFVGAPDYTASVDAVIQLIWEKLPGWGWQVGPFSTDGISRAQLAEPVETKYGPGIGVRAHSEADTPALALLLAFLRAWEARGEKA